MASDSTARPNILPHGGSATQPASSKETTEKETGLKSLEPEATGSKSSAPELVHLTKDTDNLQSPRDHLFDIIIVPDLIEVSEEWGPSDKSEFVQAIKSHARVFLFRYCDFVGDQDVSDIVSVSKLKRCAEAFRKLSLVESQQNPKIPVILVACGYGGILCEQALMDEINATEAEKTFLDRARRLVLVGTPHFDTGLLQWAEFFNRLLSSRLRWYVSAGWKDNIIATSSMQRDFRNTFTKQSKPDEMNQDRRSRFIDIKPVENTGLEDLEIACCFTSPINPKTDPVIDRVWEILDGTYLVGVEPGFADMVDFFRLQPQKSKDKEDNKPGDVRNTDQGDHADKEMSEQGSSRWARARNRVRGLAEAGSQKLSSRASRATDPGAYNREKGQGGGVGDNSEHVGTLVEKPGRDKGKEGTKYSQNTKQQLENFMSDKTAPRNIIDSVGGATESRFGPIIELFRDCGKEG